MVTVVVVVVVVVVVGRIMTNLVIMLRVMAEMIKDPMTTESLINRR